MLRALRRRKRLVVWTTITVLVAASDWPTRVAANFWSGYPMATSIVSGLLLFGVAAFVVEELLDVYEARRWRRVASLAYLSLGHLASETQQRLHFLLSGSASPHVSPPLDEERVASLRVILQDLPEGATSETRLPRLLDDVEWLRLCRLGLEDMKFRYRDSLTTWIPAMLASERLTRAVEHLAGVDEDRDALEGRIIRLIKVADPDYADHAPASGDPEFERQDAIARWQRLEIEYIATQEALMRSTRNDQWENVALRRRLGPAAGDQIERRVAELNATINP